MSKTRSTATYVLTFESPQHMLLHNICLDHDFAFKVNADLAVGRRYVHHKSPLEVLLLEGEGKQGKDEYEYRVSRLAAGGDPHYILTDRDYSMLEWQWMTNPDDTAEMLRKELHILLRVRPHYLASTNNVVLGIK